MKRVPTALLVLISLLLASCNKDIFFSNGTTTQTMRMVSGRFRFIEMYDNVDVKLVHSDGNGNDSTTLIKITTGENLTVDAIREMAVQVNGKLRSTIKVAADADDQTVIDAACADEKIKRQMEGMQLVKTIVVKNKLINLILKPAK